MRSETTQRSSARFDHLPEITPEMVEFYVRRGRRLQAAAFADAMRRGGSALGFPSGRRAAPAPPGEVAETARNALAAIRSSAELDTRKNLVN